MSPRAPPLVLSIDLRRRLIFFALSSFFLYIIYSNPLSYIYLQPDRNYGQDPLWKKSGLVETWIWFITLSCIVSLFAVQGSDPGRLPPGNHRPLPLNDDATETLVFSFAEDGSRYDTTSITSSSSSAAASRRADSAIERGGGENAMVAERGDAVRAMRAYGGGIAGIDDPDTNALAGAPRAPMPPEALAVLTSVQEIHQTNVEAAIAGVRECPTCTALQPARAHHCRDCDSCVALFDHHCSALNTCIGERNRARFLLFVWAHAAMVGTAIGCLNVAFIFKVTDADWRSANGWLIALLVILWIVQVFMLPLALFHAWLAATNTTTFEVLRGPGRLWYLADNDDARDCDLPFARTCWGNVLLFWCGLEAWDCYGMPHRACCGKPKSHWKPFEWKAVKTNRSALLSESLWENQYFSCC